MTWAEPTWVWALAVVAVVAVVAAWTGRAHVRRLAALFRGELLERILPRSVRLRRVARDTFTVLGMALVVLALMEPRFGKRLREIEAEGVDLVLAVDLSRSMDADDVDPSRLERARREILDLIDLLEGDRVGLVMYAGGAYPRMPLTLDYRALDMIVRELSTHTFQAQGSALGLAIRESLSLLSTTDRQAGRAILVLTDGEIHDADDALAAAREAAEAGVVVYGLVVGREASTIPNGDGSVLIDPSTGEPVRTAPSDDLLEDVARMTGGAVVRSVPGAEDVAALYSDEMRNHLKASIGRTARREAWQTAFHWPLGLATLLLLAAAWLGDGRRTVLIGGLALLLVAPGSASAQTVLEGDRAYRAGDYADAVEIFTELTLERPEDPDLFGRLGAARYRAGDYNGAARAFERQRALTGDPDASFNAGNAYWRSGRLEQAQEAYRQTVEADPEHEAARKNFQMVTQELAARRAEQEQPPQQQQQQQQQDGQQQDGQQQDGQQQQGQPQQGGSQQDGQQQDGQPQQAEPQDGQPQDGSEQEPQDGQQGDESSASDGGQRADGDEQEQADLDEIQAQGDGQPTDEPGDTDGEGQGQGGSPTDGSPSTDMSQEQAERVLDGVEEGRPRVYIPGERGDKPW